MIIGAVYFVGVDLNSPRPLPGNIEYCNLQEQKHTLIRRINEWRKFIPLMRQPFASQYEGSLRKAIGDTSTVNSRISKLETEYHERNARLFYSWFAPLMKEEE